MRTLLHPTYFPSIYQMAVMAQSNKIVFEKFDNYQKQTYRNRCVILGPNGKQTLSVPVNYTQKKRQLYKDVKIANDYKWQINHLKSWQTAYRTSPFYEFYEEDFLPLFNKSYDYLLDLNLQCLDLFQSLLQFKLDIDFTMEYANTHSEVQDYRELVTPTFSTPQLPKYSQVFENKFNFISNLSVLDLLFNEGPNTLNYLQAVEIN
ncbi:MAG: hypothetical protein HKN99_02835 [Winogradskyella sp.]|nr:WbqC family protein [Bacteroidia bacterium]NNC44796.1 hypothetical protein [Winogradskyella sp.]NNK40328.1 hypothetical protein [Winogradskyella sp.]